MTLPIRYLVAFGLATIALAQSAEAQSVISEIIIALDGNAEQLRVDYNCEGENAPRSVTYINAAPNFLALVTIDDKTLIMSSVIAGSGVRYASGQYVWWTKGAEASLFDETQGPDASAVATCLEVNQTP